MKNLLFTLFCFLLSINYGNTQSWEQNYMADTTSPNPGFGFAYDLIQTNDGGYVMAGEMDLPTGAIRHYIQLIKTDANGNEEWRKLMAPYYDIRMDKVTDLHLMPDNGLLLGGSTHYNNQGLLIIRTDENGDTLWTKVHPTNAIISSFSKTSDYTFLSIARTNTDLILLKTDSLGNLILSKTLDAFFYPFDIQEMSNGDYIIAGERNGAFYLAKTNNLGDTLWTKSYQFSTADAATCIQALPNGEFIIGGYGMGIVSQSPIMAKFDSNGNMIWQSYLSTPISGMVRVSDIALHSNGNYLVTGSIDRDSWFASASGFFAEISPIGQTIQLDTFDSTISAGGSSIILTADDCYAIAGGSNQGYYLRYQCGTTSTLPKINYKVEIQTFPNPSSNTIQFNINTNEYQKFELRIFDSRGELVKNENINRQYELKHLPSGTYFYGLFIDNQLIGNGQILFID